VDRYSFDVGRFHPFLHAGSSRRFPELSHPRLHAGLSRRFHSALDKVAAELNGRPRKTLNWKKPIEVFEKLTAEHCVAMID
jgi:hypothetical protein